MLCFIFVNQIHEEEPGTREKGIINEKKAILDTSVRKPNFIYPNQTGASHMFLVSCCLQGLSELENCVKMTQTIIF